MFYQSVSRFISDVQIQLGISGKMENWQTFICERTDTEVLQYVRSRPELINMSDSTDRHFLQGAAFYLKAELVEELLKLGADPNQLDPAGQLPLHSAIESYEDSPVTCVEIVKLLLDHGADIEKRDFPDFTALHRACLTGAIDIVSLLLSHGADINARSESMISIFLAGEREKRGR